MNKRDRFHSLLIPVEKRFPKVYKDESDIRNSILIWIPPKGDDVPEGIFRVAKAGLFVIQQQQIIDNPEIKNKFNLSGDLFGSCYYATSWMNLYPPEEE